MGCKIGEKSLIDLRALQYCLLAAFIAWTQGCASTNSTARQTPSHGNHSNRMVMSSNELVSHQRPFEGRLPLGIGARFDLFVADAASGVSDFYNSYVKPIRNGKLFNRQPYELDYSILPKKGTAFNTKNDRYDTVSMKSDYKFQIGISRNFRGISDFLKPAFWLAIGKYSTSNPPREQDIMSLEDMQLRDMESRDVKFDLNAPLNLDLDTALDERWNLD